MIISKTPIRISFAGGGTDLKAFYAQYGGSVVSSAIDKYIYVTIKKRFDDKIRVAYTKTEMVDSVDEIQHDLVREALRMAGIAKGVEIVTLADIPSEGTGLGSSSSLTVGLLNAFHTYQGFAVGARELAEQACKIEIDILKKPIGKQDQYIAAFGGLRRLRFHTNGDTEVETVPVEPTKFRDLEANLILLFTGITRSASSILDHQQRETPSKSEFLLAIRDQCSMIEQVLADGDIDSVGRILHDGWNLKKQLTDGITTDDINNMYETALANGAVGGKITGAGGGGFLLLYAPVQNQPKIKEKLGLQELPFKMDPYGSRIIFNIE